MLIFKKHKNVKAFTLLEMIIGLTISSIIIAMVYLIYSNISRQMVSYTQQQNELMEYNQFQNVWSREIQLAKRINAETLREIRLELNKQHIEYRLEESQIIRESKTVDTFDIPVKEVTITLKQGKKVDHQIFIIKTELLGQEMTIFEEKQLTVAQKINEYFLNEH